MKTTVPKGYRPELSICDTEDAIKSTKDFFETQLSEALNLQRVTAPLFVKVGTGIQDNLNGTERPVTFNVKADNDSSYEIVHSLAKWKRLALRKYQIEVGSGLYTDMNAIRPDEEELDNIHSVYVDQWDWEKSITPSDRNLECLKQTVKAIYGTIKETEEYIAGKYSALSPFLPHEISFVHSEELIDRYPGMTRKEKEHEICKEQGAVFLIGIGGELQDGKSHDGRAPDYDDWSTVTGPETKGLNGDILVWNPLLGNSFELSSMGIRVDREALMKQLKIRDCEARKNLYWHKMLINGELPESIGGGIGQSRLCMLMLHKAHIGEVQVGVWPKEVVDVCNEGNIPLL